MGADKAVLAQEGGMLEPPGPRPPSPQKPLEDLLGPKLGLAFEGCFSSKGHFASDNKQFYLFDVVFSWPSLSQRDFYGQMTRS